MQQQKIVGLVSGNKQAQYKIIDTWKRYTTKLRWTNGNSENLVCFTNLLSQKKKTYTL